MDYSLLLLDLSASHRKLFIILSVLEVGHPGVGVEGRVDSAKEGAEIIPDWLNDCGAWPKDADVPEAVIEIMRLKSITICFLVKVL